MRLPPSHSLSTFLLFTHIDNIFSDEKYFDRPQEFLPERFLKNPFGVRTDVPDDPARRDNLIFGGGKRVCPGLIFAKSSLVCLVPLFHVGGNVSDEMVVAATLNDEHGVGVQLQEGYQPCYGEGAPD